MSGQITLYNALENIRGSTIKQRAEGLRSRSILPHSTGFDLTNIGLKAIFDRSTKADNLYVHLLLIGLSPLIHSLATPSLTRHTIKSWKTSSVSYLKRRKTSPRRKSLPSPLPFLDFRRAPMLSVSYFSRPHRS